MKTKIENFADRIIEYGGLRTFLPSANELIALAGEIKEFIAYTECLEDEIHDLKIEIEKLKELDYGNDFYDNKD